MTFIPEGANPFYALALGVVTTVVNESNGWRSGTQGIRLTRQSLPQRCNHEYGRSYRLMLAERSSMIARRSLRTRERRECWFFLPPSDLYMRSIEGRNRDENVDRPRTSSSISRSNTALSSSSFSNARSGSTVDSRSRAMCSLKSSLEVDLGSGSISAVWISLLYVTRSYRYQRLARRWPLEKGDVALFAEAQITPVGRQSGPA